MKICKLVNKVYIFCSNIEHYCPSTDLVGTYLRTDLIHDDMLQNMFCTADNMNKDLKERMYSSCCVGKEIPKHAGCEI